MYLQISDQRGSHIFTLSFIPQNSISARDIVKVVDDVRCVALP